MRLKARAGLIGVVWVLMHLSSQAQTNPGINYQAVARDHMGNELATESIDVRFSVLSGSPSGTVIYQEVHANVLTSKYGVFNLVIGSGVPSGGMVDAFDLIAWEEARHYLKVEIKFDQRYLDMGTMQFLAVPYALFAYKSLEPGPAGPEGPQGPPGDEASDDQTLSFDGNNLSIDGGNQVNLSSLINDSDPDASNELQYLSLKGDTLSITDGNFVTFAKLDVDDDDPDPANELQHVQLSDDELTLTDSPIAVSLSKYLDNTDNQQLGFNTRNYKLGISGSDSVNLSSLKNDADADPTNEIQDLKLEGNTLSITLNGSPTEIDLSPYLDNTDTQDISKNELTKELTIDNGSTLDMNEFIKDDDADSTNELVTEMRIEGSELVIEEGSNESRVNLSTNIIAFRAKKTNSDASSFVTDVDMLYDDATSYNDGAAYSSTTGIFTAPLDGVYSFVVSFEATGAGSDRELFLHLNGAVYETLATQIGQAELVFKSITLKLSKDDEVNVVVNTGTSSETGIGSFSGYRVY